MRAQKSPTPLESVAYRVLLGSLVGRAGIEACLAAEDGVPDAAAQDNVGFAFDTLADKLITLAEAKLG